MLRLVPGEEVIGADNLVPLIKETIDEMGADKAGAACH